MKDFQHYYIGLTISYIAFYGFGFYEFPLNSEYLNNYLTPLLGAMFGGIAGFFWERHYEIKNGTYFNINDIYRTAFGGLLGGILSFCWISQSLMLFLAITSVIMVIREIRK